MFASYARALEVRNLAAIIGEEELSQSDRDYLAFGKAFEERFVNQGEDEDRTIFETLSLSWELLSLLPPEALTRLTEEDLAKYHSWRKSAGKSA